MRATYTGELMRDSAPVMAAGQVGSDKDRIVSKHEIGTKLWSWRLRKERKNISSSHDKSDLKDIKLMMHPDILSTQKKM